MCYILYMNKDVIYVEPEDDITDIILKIEKSKEKIVALVPPKKAGVFRSVVNIKLIAKSGASTGKKIVFVTVDPSIVRLAATAKIPVTKNLQTAPAIPTIDTSVETSKKETLVEESDGTVETEEDIEELEEGDEQEDDADEDSTNDDKTPADDDEEEDTNKTSDKEEKPAKKENSSTTKAKAKDAQKSSNRFVGWIKEHKKLAICGVIGLLVLICGLVWAFTIAPAVNVTVGIRTTSNNFSESVSFTTTMNEENADEGKFYLDEKKVESIQEVEFEATGSKNIGEKATGEVTVIATVSADGGTIQVKAGDTFTNGGLSFVADKGVTMTYDGKDDSVCDNADSVTKREFNVQGCRIYAKVKVTAAEPGTKYNISARDSGWDSSAPVSAYSTNAMSGGTDDTVTVVLQSDIDKAKNELTAANENENKEKLFSEISKDALLIDSSFSQSTSEAISTPGVGEEVKEGEKPKLKAVTTAKVYTIDKTKVEEFITKKANIAEDQKIYEMKDPFIENFTNTAGGFTGKLKTSYMTGPKVSVSSIVELIKGRGLGDAQHALKDIDGITDVHMNTSFPWVTSVPSDTNKITVDLDIKDQSGNKVEAPSDEQTKPDGDDKASPEENQKEENKE